MIRTLYRTEDGHLQTNLELSTLGTFLKDADGLLWVDMAGEAPEICEPILLDTFGFHPLAVDDALYEKHVPKADDWGTYLYLTMHALVLDGQEDPQVRVLELDVFLGKNFIVTYHEEPIASIGEAWATCQRDERYLSRGPDHLLYRLVDELVTGYLVVSDELDETIDVIQDEVLAKPTTESLTQVLALKRVALKIRRTLSPQREVLNKLARDDFAVVDAEDRIFFRDAYDHLVRLYEINESLRDLISGALDTYLSVVNNRMNNTMKALTIITTLFMPITFVSGFFGMNFFGPVASLDGWTSRIVLGLVLAVMLATPVAMYLWMRGREWL